MEGDSRGTEAELLGTGVIGVAAAMIVRHALVAIIVIWSLKADDKGRKHALAVLRVLRSGR